MDGWSKLREIAIRAIEEHWDHKIRVLAALRQEPLKYKLRYLWRKTKLHLNELFGVDNYEQPLLYGTKEKYGTLRLEYSSGDDVSFTIEEIVEEISSTICQFCGKPGHQREGGWILTLCDDCDADRTKKVSKL